MHTVSLFTVLCMIKMVVWATIKKGKVILWQSKQIRSHIRSECVNITLSSLLLGILKGGRVPKNLCENSKTKKTKKKRKEEL